MYTAKQHLKYNLWANLQLIEGLKPVNEKILNLEAKSSFPGIAKTILHISDAEFIWLKRLQGESISHWPSAGFNGTKDDLFAILIKSSADLISYIELKGDSFLSSTIDYQSMKGESFSNQVDGLLHHIVNHGTYHRGQVITMLRQAGITTLPSTDVVKYLRTL